MERLCRFYYKSVSWGYLKYEEGMEDLYRKLNWTIICVYGKIKGTSNDRQE